MQMRAPTRVPLEVLLGQRPKAPCASEGALRASLLGAVAHTRTTRRAHGGRRPDLDNRYFRSMWEANWARYLNFLVQHRAIREWQYEPDTFWFDRIKRGTRSYTPDFRVTENDGQVIYHEIKGWLDRESRTKLSRMAIYHPSVRVQVIDKHAYRRAARSLSRLIPGWETEKRVA